MTKKIKALQILRFIIQVGFFVLLPGLFTLAFSEIQLIYSMLLKGNFNFIEAFPRLIEVITIIPITMLFGRFFCGWICAFGFLNDFIYKISRLIFKTKFRINPKLDSTLKYLKYIILAFIVYLIWTKGSTRFSTFSPWDAFAQVSQLPQAIFDYTVGFILLAIIIIGSFFIERFFCRYLCPLGGLLGVISKVRLFKIDKPSDNCGGCRVCTKNCAMGIKLYKMDKVSSGECINCLKCIKVCPRKNVQGNFLNENINSALASSIVIVAFLWLYTCSSTLGNLIEGIGAGSKKSMPTTGSTKSSVITQNNNDSARQPIATKKNTLTSSIDNNSTQKIYKDGTYTGVGRGFRPGLNVSVTVKSDKITNIEVVSLNDTRRYFSEPVSVVPEEIIQAQSTKVDAVSGATRTSDGIMMAVANALNKAKV